jgi:hypothetical protein
MGKLVLLGLLLLAMEGERPLNPYPRKDPPCPKSEKCYWCGPNGDGWCSVPRDYKAR